MLLGRTPTTATRAATTGLQALVTCVVVQRKCPPNWSAKMSVQASVPVSGCGVLVELLIFLSGGLSGKAYLLTVFLWMPSSRAIALRESPLNLAYCTFSQRVRWRAIGIRCCCALDLRGLKSRSTSPVSNVARWESHRSPVPLMPRDLLPGN